MLERVLAAVGMLLIATSFITWVVCLARWDGDTTCDKSECDSCPFPCPEHERK